MAKKLLSPELGRVLKDVENAREAINEKYEVNGFPKSIQAPLLSGDLASRIRDIFVLNTQDGTAKPEDVIKDKIFYSKGQRIVGNMPEQYGNVKLDIDHFYADLEPGYYPNGIHVVMEDFTQDATAEPSNVAEGKVFYANRQRLIGTMPRRTDSITLNVNTPSMDLPSGYYPEGVHGEIDDYTVSYIWNIEGMPAQTQHPQYNGNFNIPDFKENVIMPDEYDFIGWSHIPNDTNPEFKTGDRLSRYDLSVQHDTAYLYAVWEPVPRLNDIYVPNAPCIYGAIYENSTTNFILQQCTLTFRYAENGFVAGVVYSKNGLYNTENLSSVTLGRNYSVEVSTYGYDTQTFEISVPNISMPYRQTFSLASSLREEEKPQFDELLKATVTWEENKDLDTHIQDLNNNDLIYHGNKKYTYANGAELELQRDCLSTNGTESIILKNNKNVSFIYKVYNNNDETCNMTARQDVYVNVVTDDGECQRFTIKKQNKNYLHWNVFKYENGKITVIDTYDSEFEDSPPDFTIDHLTLNVGSTPYYFDKDDTESSVYVPKNVTTASVDCTTVDNRMSVKINDSNSKLVTIRSKDGTLIDKIIIDICLDSYYHALLKADEGNIRRYAIYLIEKRDEEDGN